MLLSVVILAAGQGKRMNSDLPKVLQPLAGQPLLAHVLSTARSLEPTNIIVVYGHGGAQVQAALPDEDVDWVLQAEQLGTGHAVMQAMPIIPDDHRVLVLYGDVPLIRAETLRSLLGAAGDSLAAPTPTLALLSALAQDPTGYGRIVRDSVNKVRAIVEHRDASSDQRAIREINTGVLAAPANALRGWLSALKSDNAQGEYLLTDVVAAAVQVGAPVGAMLAADESEVTGVNDKRQLAAVEAIYRSAKADELMRAGATLSDPARIDIRGEVSVERDVFIDVNAVLVGRVHLGARVKVGPNCYLRNATIGADTEIFANSVIDEVAVGVNCRIGPFARLRPGSVLQNEVHIGNFVEVKNSRIGTGSKANHLTYLGDTRVGNEVNVGAGTITCNYDGLNKWPSVIEDGAFIGSGAMLVAPVRIGAKATIGAGSTITTTAPDGKLTLSRARQTTIEGWNRPEKFSEADQAAAIDLSLQKPKDS